MTAHLFEPDRVQRLLAELRRASETGHIKWRDDGDGYVADVGKSRFAIRATDGDDFHPYDLAANHEGKQVLLISSQIRDGMVGDAVENDLLSSIYAMAKHSATGVDLLMAGLFEDLEQADPDWVPF